MKALALVKINNQIGLVLDEPIMLTYQKKDGCILGSDGTFLQTLFYDKPSLNWQAFGGRKFDIPLDNGEIIHCNGQYWDGIKELHRKMVDGEIISIAANDINSLKECYVFTGYKGIKHKINELIVSYKGIVYDYWEYEMLITKNPYRRTKKKLKPVLRKLRNQTRKLRAKKLITTNHATRIHPLWP